MLHIQTNGITYEIRTADQLVKWVSLSSAGPAVMQAFLRTLEVVKRSQAA